MVLKTEETVFDKPFFEQVLREGYRDEEIELLDVTHENSNPKGINFLSEIFRIKLTFLQRNNNNNNKNEHNTGEKNNNEENSKVKRTIHIVVKTEPTIAKELVRQQELFTTELKFYRNILPKIERSINRKIAPRFFYGIEDARIIVMENLAKKGFAIKNRQKGLPLAHCLMVVERIAELHAGSIALYEKDPQLVRSFRNGVLSSKCPITYFRLIEVSLLNVSRAMRNWSDERFIRAADKIEKLVDSIRERLTHIYEYDDTDFCVLNHGDCWINNMMFRENEKGEPYDLIMVDYQMSVYSSPAIDLLYFLSICPEIGVKCHEDDRLLETYLKTLRSNMKAAGCKTEPPTLEKLKHDMYKRRSYAVFAGLVLFPRMMADIEDTEDFDKVFNQLAGETRMDVFKNPDAVAAAKIMIPVMEQRGYLD